MSEFKFNPSKWVPYFDDQEICEKVRNVKRKDITETKNPNLKVTVVKDNDMAFLRIWDIFSRIKQASENDKKLVLILPQPHPQYRKVAYLINKYRINCKKLYTFNMDEWADDDGNIAPETYPRGFMYAMLNNFYYNLDDDIKPPRENIQGPNDKNLKDYGKMIEDLGGADVCYGGIGWSGHLAFIEPGSKEFEGTFEEFKQMGSRLVTLSPFTIAQSCMDPDFGMSGDWAAIPPRAATIGPAQILGARHYCSWNSFTIGTTPISWQRFTVRFALHGPVTQKVPSTLLQIRKADVFISETIAQDIPKDTELSWY
jgi:glucosamine-6-phosphate deaminase